MTNTQNPWKYVQLDEGDLGKNPYLNSPKTPASTTSSGVENSAPNVDTAAPVTVSNLNDFVVFSNLSCIDADGKVFETYPELRVRKDIFRDSKGQQINNRPYDAAVYCEKNGLFLPSFALTCNILAALYQAAVRKETNGTYTTLDAEVKKVLDQYKNHGAGFGYHAQNTIIDYGTPAVIHYPTAADFAQTTAVNAHQQRIPKQFVKIALQDSLVENVLSSPTHNFYIRQLTGLVNPADLVEIGKYFGKPAKLWFPWTGQAGAAFNDKRAAWFGCSSINFYLYGGSSLYNYDAARGVKRA